MDGNEIEEFINGLPEIEFDINYTSSDNVFPCIVCGGETTMVFIPQGKAEVHEYYCDEHYQSYIRDRPWR